MLAMQHGSKWVVGALTVPDLLIWHKTAKHPAIACAQQTSQIAATFPRRHLLPCPHLLPRPHPPLYEGGQRAGIEAGGAVGGGRGGGKRGRATLNYSYLGLH